MPPVNNVWASQTPIGATEQLTLPSGQTCIARRLGMEGLIEAGILAEADSLSGLVDQHVRKVRGAKGRTDGNELDERALLRDRDTMKAIITIADKAIPVVVAEPEVMLHYTTDSSGKTSMIPLEDREPGQVYTDMIGLEDKMFLFEWAVGSLSNLNTFRSQPGADVAGVGDGGGVSRKTKRNPRSR